jgi:hypothetical protein
LEQTRGLHRHDADRKGFGHSPTSILNLDLKNPIQKLQVGTNLPCLPQQCVLFVRSLKFFRLEKNAMLTLEWIGKNKVVNHHREVPFRVLERQYSFDEQGQYTENNDSENMIIHGDNLEALKALLPQYEGKVKCIYIVILTPILMSILSSENAVRLNFIIHIMFLALFEMRNYNVLCGGAKWTI